MLVFVVRRDGTDKVWELQCPPARLCPWRGAVPRDTSGRGSGPCCTSGGRRSGGPVLLPVQGPLLLVPEGWWQQPWREAGQEPGAGDQGLVPPVPHPRSHRLPASCPTPGPSCAAPRAAAAARGRPSRFLPQGLPPLSQCPAACGGLGPADSSRWRLHVAAAQLPGLTGSFRERRRAAAAGQILQPFLGRKC